MYHTITMKMVETGQDHAVSGEATMEGIGLHGEVRKGADGMIETNRLPFKPKKISFGMTTTIRVIEGLGTTMAKEAI